MDIAFQASFDLFEPRTAEPAPIATDSVNGNCSACGHDLSTNASWAEINHGILRDGACVSMSLLRNHTLYDLSRIERGDDHPCCWGKEDLHGKKITNPTHTHRVEHFQESFSRADTVWSLRREDFHAQVIARGKHLGIDTTTLIPALSTETK